MQEPRGRKVVWRQSNPDDDEGSEKVTALDFYADFDLVNSTDEVGHVELEKLEVRDIPNDEIELSITQNYDEEQGLIFNR